MIIIVRVLTKKTMIIKIMEELTITIVTVLMMTYRRNNMEKKNKNWT